VNWWVIFNTVYISAQWDVQNKGKCTD